MEKHNAEQNPVTRLADISMTSNHGVPLLLKPYQCTPSGGNRKLALPRNPEQDLDDAHADARPSLSTRKSRVTVAPAVPATASRTSAVITSFGDSHSTMQGLRICRDADSTRVTGDL